MRRNLKRGETDLMIKPTLTALCLLASCGTMLRAEGEAVVDSTTEETKVYYLNTSEASTSYGCWNDPAKWSEAYGQVENAEGKKVWAFSGESPSEFSSDCRFIVPALSSGYTLRETAGGGKTSEWNGKSLQLGGTRHNNTYVAVLRLVTRGKDTHIKFNNDGLIMAGQSRIQPHNSSSPYNVKGIVTVTAEEAKYPALIQQTTAARNISLNFLDKLKGAASVYAAIKSSTNDFTVSFADTTEYYGTMTTTNINEDALLTVNLSSDFPGTLSVSTNVTLVPASGVKIANLKCFDGSIIDIRAGMLEVTGSFDKTGKIRVIANKFGENITPTYSDLIKFPANAEITVDDFEFVDADGEPLDCSYCDITTDSDLGTSTITAARYGYVKLLESDPTSRTTIQQSSMTNEQNWSDGLWPTNPLVDYAAIDKNLRTFDSSDVKEQPLDDFVFKGNSLIMDDSVLVVVNRSFNCRNLFLRNEATFAYTPYYNGSLYGKVTADEGNACFSVYSYKTLTIESAIEGSGNVVFTSPGGASTSDSRGYYVLKGDNDGFTGTMVVTMPYKMPTDPVADWKKVTPSFDRNYTVLNLTERGNLGGELPAVNPKAFTIENMSQVKPAVGITSLTLDEPTRGIFIKWVGRLMANEGQTFTVKSPLAVHGTLWKEGEGTLVLGNPAPTFGENADSDMPDADATNRMFRVAAGDVKIASGDAVNGLDVVFTNSASRLVLDLDSEDDTFRTFGLRNTKSATPFAVEGDVVKIPVVLDFANPPARNTERALFTISASADEDLFLSKIAIVKGEALSGMAMERSWRVNNDGSRTFVAKFTKVGLRIVIK